MVIQLLFHGVLLPGFFNIACSILVQFPSSFFSIHFVSVNMVHLYSRSDTTAAWKKSHFISLDRSDFHMINSPSVAILTFTRCILMSLSVDETLLPRYVNLSTNFGGMSFRVETPPSCLKHVLCFVYIQVRANASCCLLKAMQGRFSLGWCICKKRYVICSLHLL